MVWQNFQSFPPLYRQIRLWNVERRRRYPKEFDSLLRNLIAHTRKGQMYGDWNDGGRLLEE